ncbi:YdeI/OmpD-associated family protein [Mucilaginibacter sp. ZT4R22]|uniref:YdeI/OmpD-associated family protein n=1 Tax=Mucilaginibacter pankratovii TaxID=2772110 RepID=A0ABR7WVW7_9SPHI|nr:YdeI/OmpD-associated family protein [Mucilaginibacter pankratovii]MBD1366428.1 YdeI/OmpD-associated family protein [Mucilaginibacter pankratovii]
MSPLAKKLLVKPGQTWLVLDPPEDYLAALEPLPDGVKLVFSVDGVVDGIQMFVRMSTELATRLADIKPILKPETILWVIYPKKNKGIDTDLEMMSGWDVSKEYGLRPVASAAINDTWTTLRFRPEVLVKQSEFRNDAVKQNDHSAFINPETKTVILPADVAAAMAAAPASIEIYNKLAYSHRKEYVVWILSAKQEQTRLNRIAKMVEMLLTGKKNPSDK